MADPHSTPPEDASESHQQGATADDEIDPEQTDTEESVEALRREVEDQYDFEDFGPADMAKMSADEWEAVFDEASWITGSDLLDRVADDLRSRVETREVFARVERHHEPDQRQGKQQRVCE